MSGVSNYANDRFLRISPGRTSSDFDAVDGSAALRDLGSGKARPSA